MLAVVGNVDNDTNLLPAILHITCLPTQILVEALGLGPSESPWHHLAGTLPFKFKVHVSEMLGPGGKIKPLDRGIGGLNKVLNRGVHDPYHPKGRLTEGPVRVGLHNGQKKKNIEVGIEIESDVLGNTRLVLPRVESELSSSCRIRTTRHQLVDGFHIRSLVTTGHQQQIFSNSWQFQLERYGKKRSSEVVTLSQNMAEELILKLACMRLQTLKSRLGGLMGSRAETLPIWNESSLTRLAVELTRTCGNTTPDTSEGCGREGGSRREALIKC
ncbi:hypothetical protein C8F01DRAFT_1079370 [Mycena amicta]|nr:hypothetical protein C8F01DRAFT_1079370 [Mycena amicta]